MSFTETWLQGPSQTQFYTRLYTPQVPPVAALVFVHGFAEHIARHTPFHTKLAERGLVVFTFDQRGFGKTAMDKEHKSPSSSYGKTSWDDQLTDIVWAIEYVTEKYPSLSVFLAGHSMVLSWPAYSKNIDNVHVGRRRSLGIRHPKCRLAPSRETAFALGHYCNEPINPLDKTSSQGHAYLRQSVQQDRAKPSGSHTGGRRGK